MAKDASLTKEAAKAKKANEKNSKKAALSKKPKAIKSWITERGVKKAVVIGGGYIGLECAENLKKRPEGTAAAANAVPGSSTMIRHTARSAEKIRCFMFLSFSLVLDFTYDINVAYIFHQIKKIIFQWAFFRKTPLKSLDIV